jgi:1-aminocyclopropane-1-carboxylate deaminase/D-cysteine desulfhydrase-like pyridoxal-dependent ACC family enzyme
MDRCISLHQHSYTHTQVGGSTPLGAWGYIECIRELKAQLEKANDHVTDIFVACGSGGSAAGIALAVKLAGINAKVHAVIVSLCFCVSLKILYFTVS